MMGTHNSDRIQRAWLIAARLLLVMSLWHAPLPWLHCHHLSAGDSSSTVSQFLAHLSHFHPQAEACSDQETGWHWHWAMPYWNHVLDGTPDDEPVWLEAVTFDPIDVTPATCLPAEMVALNSFLAVPALQISGTFVPLGPLRTLRDHQPVECAWSVLRC